MRLLVLHPEGNVTNNPHLFALVARLAREGYGVDVLIPDRADVAAGELVPGCTVLKAPVEPRAYHDHTLLLRGVEAGREPEAIRSFCRKRGRYDWVLGIDRGIIEAERVAVEQGARHALLSYEIYFEEECGAEFKRPEIEACQEIAFAISQDRARGVELCRENRIPVDRLIFMPTAGSGLRSPGEGAEIRARLGLEPGSKILVYMGELGGTWSGVDELLQAAHEFPSDWKLVLHHRYGEEVARRYLGARLDAAPRNVHLSPLDRLGPEELHRLLGAGDLGAAFYLPTFVDRSCGRNLEILGLSSGKLSTYLQHGLPVVLNEIGEMADLVREFNAGFVVGSISELPRALLAFESLDCDALRSGARRLFSERLDLALGMPQLLDALGVGGAPAGRPTRITGPAKDAAP